MNGIAWVGLSPLKREAFASRAATLAQERNYGIKGETPKRVADFYDRWAAGRDCTEFPSREQTALLEIAAGSNPPLLLRLPRVTKPTVPVAPKQETTIENAPPPADSKLAVDRPVIVWPTSVEVDAMAARVKARSEEIRSSPPGQTGGEVVGTEAVVANPGMSSETTVPPGDPPLSDDEVDAQLQAMQRELYGSAPEAAMKAYGTAERTGGVTYVALSRNPPAETGHLWDEMLNGPEKKEEKPWDESWGEHGASGDNPAPPAEPRRSETSRSFLGEGPLTQAQAPTGGKQAEETPHGGDAPEGERAGGPARDPRSVQEAHKRQTPPASRPSPSSAFREGAVPPIDDHPYPTRGGNFPAWLFVAFGFVFAIVGGFSLGVMVLEVYGRLTVSATPAILLLLGIGTLAMAVASTLRI